MQTITLPVLPKFRDEYGETLSGSPVYMLAMARRGVVNLSQKVRTQGLAGELLSSIADTPKPVPPKRRRYRRRDLTAE
jgi:hypothetical protein